MSPFELPGKSFGFLPDGRNETCENCGRSTRRVAFEQDEKDKQQGVIKVKCPHCGYQMWIIDQSVAHIDKEWKKQVTKKSEE